MSTDKPREFWLGLNEKVIYTKDDFVTGTTDFYPFVHVIEKKAYDQLSAKLKVATEAFLRLEVRLFETDVTKDDIIAMKEIVRTALKTIRGE